jgi:hypothetical protein
VDLTFVGESRPGINPSAEKIRLFPNPNVLIEYGYALRCHTHAKIIGLMNAAFGEPNADTLPFDLRHLRWPITYRLSKNSAPDKADQLEKLTATLVDALRAILSQHVDKKEPAVLFVPQKPTKNAAIFHVSIEDLLPAMSGGPGPNSFVVPEHGTAYLRLYPVNSVSPIETEYDAENVMHQGGLQPFGKAERGWSATRNNFGAIVHEAPRDGNLYLFTQLFLSREIWGVDARILNSEYQSEISQEFKSPVKYIASGYIEDQFVNALEKYLFFAKSHLKVELPMRIEAGLVGIKNYSVAVGNNFVEGKSLRDALHWECDVNDDKPAWEILGPFFNLIWKTCGIERPAEKQIQLANRYAQRK